MQEQNARRLPAFPTGIDTDQPGMTLRDWFAGQMLACTADPNVTFETVEHIAILARVAYVVADAMMEARGK